MADAEFVARTTRVLTAHGLSLPEYQVMCSAGYRVTLPPGAFVSHALSAWAQDPRGESSLSELVAALDHVRERGLLSVLTEGDLRSEAERRRASRVPEVAGPEYDVGHVDFTHRGYELYREVIRAIHGDEFSMRCDSGFNLDLDAGRFDVYGVSAAACQTLMEQVQADGDAYTGEAPTTFVGRQGPDEIGEWKPNRFVLHTAGYRGALHFAIGER